MAREDTENPQTSVDENEQITQRKAKLAMLRKERQAYPNDFHRDALSDDLHTTYDKEDEASLEQQARRVRVAGRMMTRRLMGKASFVHLQDMGGRIQLYIKKDAVGDEVYEQFKDWDLGDILGAEGILFRTKTGELSVKVSSIRLLTKALRPLPDKFHGLTDQEMRYRRRYLDLMVNAKSLEVFKIRSKLVCGISKYLRGKGFLEVATPMMQPLAGGAAARPFITHHNALDMDLYLRIAPELYLKRLVVGGIEKVFEINRNFRNEGISTRHNPEFTMLEFYQAYANYQDLMDLTEDMLRTLAKEVLHTTKLTFEGQICDFSKPFRRMTLIESILHYNPEIEPTQLTDLNKARALAQSMDIAVQEHYGPGKIQYELFEKCVERRLSEPTFITAYPTEVSPLARSNNENPEVVDRFEFFVGGREIANGFSELNDPEEQARRFKQQAIDKAAGNDEAMVYDEDYITALEYGLPPTAGEGIGIDRLVMLFTDSASIRDVILFPLLRAK